MARGAAPRPGAWGNVMAKYDPLSCYLKQQASPVLTLSFVEIESILGAKLPQSARTTKRWWWSDPMPRSSNVQCRAWVDSGYVAESVDVGDGHVTFRRGRPVAKWRIATTKSRANLLKSSTVART
jgi:hypothetical protein